MARILIVEPSADIRVLLERSVAHVGHEPIAYRRSRHGVLPLVDVLLLEPAFVGGIALASRLRADQPDAAIVICSIFPPGPRLQELDAVAYVLKPFQLDALDDAVRLAVASVQRILR